MQTLFKAYASGRLSIDGPSPGGIMSIRIALLTANAYFDFASKVAADTRTDARSAFFHSQTFVREAVAPAAAALTLT
jgi:hypothetical protein